MEKPEGQKVQHPQFYVFLVNDIDWEPYTTGREIVNALVSSGVWFGARHFPYKDSYKPGDRVLFYVAGKKARFFTGDAVIGSGISAINDEDEQLIRKLGLEGFDKRLSLDAVNLWVIVSSALRVVA